MRKLKKIYTVCCDEENNVLIYYNRNIQEIMEKDGHHIYQGIKLTRFKNSIEDVKYQYSSVNKLLIENIQLRFSNFQVTTVLGNILRLSDYKTWPIAPHSLFGKLNLRISTKNLMNFFYATNATG